MAEKIAQGVIMESPSYRRGKDAGGKGGADGGPDGGPRSPHGHGGDEERIEQARLKRDGSRGTVVLGVAMMFLGSGLGWGFALGGALMTLGGTASAIFWGRRLRALQEDPWDDAEIDAWERDHIEGTAGVDDDDS